MGEALIDVDANLKWLDNVCNFYAKGKEIYDGCARILAESPGSELIVSPANLGDTVFIATLSVAYKKAHGVKNLLIAVSSLLFHHKQELLCQWNQVWTCSGLCGL